MTTVDLSTRYLGLTLRNPIVLGSSPLALKRDTVRRLEELGLAAIVLPSLYEKELEHDEVEMMHLVEFGTDQFGEATDYIPELEDYHTGPRDYLRTLEESKHILGIPVMASLNATSLPSWKKYAKQIESAGADALELNLFGVSADPTVSAADMEERWLEIVSTVTSQLQIPVAVKLAPYLAAPANIGKRLIDAGARGLVLFNRIEQPDIDLEELHIIQDHHLSAPEDKGWALRWLGILRDIVPVSLAASTGVHTHDGVIKMLLAGADITQMTSAVIANGPGILPMMLEGLRGWLEENEDESVEQIKGSMSRARCEEPGEYERAHHMKPLIHYTHED